MKFASLIPLLLVFLGACKEGPSDLPARPGLGQAIASAAPELVRARYVLVPSSYLSAPVEAPANLTKALLASGFSGKGLASASSPAWSPAAGKAVIFSEGWVWITDQQGKKMRSIWFEPDLRVDGILQWSDDSTQLRLKADGWRRWVYLDLELENPLK